MGIGLIAVCEPGAVGRLLAAFAHAGIPMGMLFVRNANGSHNPFEKMDIADLLQAARLLTWWLVKNCAE